MKIFKLADDFEDRLDRHHGQQHRRRILMDLVKEIESGKFTHQQIDPDKLYQMHNSVRHEYQSPKDISGHNPGGQTMIWEMDAGMEDAF
ncbi:hypothetical protein LCGC14_0526230 [marine sediment metagenome]|uniref:Uncharacterized protein n=1 Tax=marine sediment metagenome TaxID=412755 RepID=A0A0F9V536_9ZZZZ